MDQQPNSEQQDQPKNTPEQPQPVAYDSEGRPLYAAPPSSTPGAYGAQPAPQFVHLSRAVSPIEQPISDEIKKRHDESAKAFPGLNLSGAEYIISAVPRHFIGMVGPIVLAVFFVAVVASLLINYSLIVSSLGIMTPPPFGAVLVGGLFLIALVVLYAYVSVWIYTNNRFYLTNESVIQEIQTSLFARREQTVSLANIEDASYTQHGLLQMMLNYGSIRLSTEGDETTYRFGYVVNPKAEIAVLNNAVEAFKNGRPVEMEQEKQD